MAKTGLFLHTGVLKVAPPPFLKVHGHTHTASVNCKLTRQAMAISSLASWSKDSTVSRHTPLSTGSISLVAASQVMDAYMAPRPVEESVRAELSAEKEEGRANTLMLGGMASMAAAMGPFTAWRLDTAP